MRELFNVAFQGEIDDHFSKQQVIENLKKAMNASDEKIEKLFSGKLVVIKKNVPKAQVDMLSAKLQKMGALSKVVPASASAKAPQARELKLVPQVVVQEQESSRVETIVPEAAQVAGYGSLSPTTEISQRPYHVINVVQQTSGLLGALYMWGVGLGFLLFGLVLMLAFSPFPGGVIRRGMLMGAFLSGYGIFKILRRMGEAKQ